jgi:hypothetical protein
VVPSYEVQASSIIKSTLSCKQPNENAITTMGLFGIHPFTYAPNKTTFDGKTDFLNYW